MFHTGLSELSEQEQILKQFHDECEEYRNEYNAYKKHNDYSPEVRQIFSFYIDNLHRDGIISDDTVFNITM